MQFLIRQSDACHGPSVSRAHSRGHLEWTITNLDTSPERLRKPWPETGQPYRLGDYIHLFISEHREESVQWVPYGRLHGPGPVSAPKIPRTVYLGGCVGMNKVECWWVEATQSPCPTFTFQGWMSMEFSVPIHGILEDLILMSAVVIVYISRSRADRDSRLRGAIFVRYLIWMDFCASTCSRRVK